MNSWICLYACACFPLTVQAGEAEHADLLGDVVPGARGAQTLQFGLQLIPHQQNTVCHGLHITLPTREEQRGGEEGVRQMRKEKGCKTGDEKNNDKTKECLKLTLQPR